LEDEKMAYNLEEINDRARRDPGGFVRDCGQEFENKIRLAADRVMENMKKSPILLISGPSGSGKTTTSKKIEEELRNRGITCYALAMDSYFKTIDESSPRDKNGGLDLESPLCMDMELLNQHFEDLSEGREIHVPKYNFAKQRRDERHSVTIKLRPNDLVAVEGIHALNDMITDVHPEAMKLYISARSNVEDSTGRLVFKGTWMRLVRRMVRDSLFRGASPEYTMGLWENIRRGEKQNISPFKDKADLKFDSSFPFEVNLFRRVAQPLFEIIPQGVPRFSELGAIHPAFELFEPIDTEYLGPESLLREFLGGGKYKY
jgi:uridine kinase